MAAEYGIIEKAYESLSDKIISTYGIVRLDFVVDFVKYLQENKLDAHLLIGGPNGVGKSMLMLALMEGVDPGSVQRGNIIYAYHHAGDFIRYMSKPENRNTALGVDEINTLLHFRQSITTGNLAVNNSIEIGREHRICVISCCKDARRVDRLYRDGKVQIYIFVTDRFDEKKEDQFKSYAFVFANPIGSVFEIEDKFMLRYLENIQSFESLRAAAEQLPTFMGYLFVDDVEKYVKPEHIQAYQDQKEEGIQATNKKWEEKVELKERAAVETDTPTKLHTIMGKIGELQGIFSIQEAYQAAESGLGEGEITAVHVAAALKELELKGRVRKLARGRYAATVSAEEAAALAAEQEGQQ